MNFKKFGSSSYKILIWQTLAAFSVKNILWVLNCGRSIEFAFDIIFSIFCDTACKSLPSRKLRFEHFDTQSWRLCEILKIIWNKIWNLSDQSTIFPKFIYDKEGKLAGLTQILPVKVRGPALLLKTVKRLITYWNNIEIELFYMASTMALGTSILPILINKRVALMWKILIQSGHNFGH